mgnify:CR=1 FL=1
MGITSTITLASSAGEQLQKAIAACEQSADAVDRGIAILATSEDDADLERRLHEIEERGRDVPAQAIAQVCELTWQLKGQATGRQVEGAKVGITANQGLFGHGSSVILAR